MTKRSFFIWLLWLCLACFPLPLASEMEYCRLLAAPEPSTQEPIWESFLAWYRKAPPNVNPMGGYRARLEKDGLPQEEIERRMALIVRLFSERKEGVEIFFDHTYSKASGDPVRDGFNSTPSALLIEAVKNMKPGRALDAGMGQGRNAVYLAQEGWQVTGFDISSAGLAAARFNAKMAAVEITTVKASYEDFGFGQDQWDLIVLTFAWAPMEDPAFIKALTDSLRSGGRVIFEHYIDNPVKPQPKAVHALRPNQLRSIFKDYKIERYEETDRMGDWGGHGERLVRMVARKP